MNSGLSKQERISSVKAIDQLIAKGRYVNLGVIRCCYRVREDNKLSLNRMMVSVPKRLFKRAVKRNLLKRRMREAYRLQKSLLEGCERIDMIFIYSSKDVAQYAEIHEAVGGILKKIGAREQKVQASSPAQTPVPGQSSNLGQAQNPEQTEQS